MSGFVLQRALAAIVVTSAVISPAWSQSTKSVWDGVYTAAQAERGKSQYEKSCAGCHGEKLQGSNDNPGLTGPYFLVHWNSRPISTLFDLIQIQMPPANPGSLPPNVTADIVAFILASNGLPAGAAELPRDSSSLTAIAVKTVK